MPLPVTDLHIVYPPDGPPPPQEDHAYFEALAALPGSVAYTMRDQAEIDPFVRPRGNPPGPQPTYDPAEDACRITIQETDSTADFKYRMPIPWAAEEGVCWIVWDSKFDSSWQGDMGIGAMKLLQIGSTHLAANRFFEFRIRSGGADLRPDRVMKWQAKLYDEIWIKGPNIADDADGRLGPYAAEMIAAGYPEGFEVRPDMWTRTWWRLTRRRNDWDTISCWVADEVEGPILNWDELQIDMGHPDGGDTEENRPRQLHEFWIEYNASGGAATRPLVSWHRNLVQVFQPDIPLETP